MRFLPESETVPGSHSFSPAVCRSHQPTALWPLVRRTLGKIYPVDFRIADVEQAVGNVARILYAQSGVLYVKNVVGIVGEYYGGDILLFSGLSPEALNGVSGTAISQQGQHRSVGAGQRSTRRTGPSLTNGAPVRLSQLFGAVF